MRMMIYLAQQKRIVSSSELARMMNISRRHLSGIAKKLNKNGYIDVEFGMHGGYSLARSTDKISMYDIVVLMEGTFYVSHRLTETSLCKGIPHFLHTGYGFLQDIIECYLRSITIAFLVDQPVNTWRRTAIDQLNDLFSTCACVSLDI